MAAALSIAVVALPLAAAAVLALVPSWRIGTRINAVAATLEFAATCALAWHVAAAHAYLALLAAWVAMTTGWFGLRDVPAALAARIINRARVRVYHVGFQVLIAALQLGTAAADPVLVWLAMALASAAVATMASASLPAADAAPRVALQGATGLSVALLGTLLLGLTPVLAGIFLLLGHGVVAGLVPVKPLGKLWSLAIAHEGAMPGTQILGGLLPNAPLLLFQRLHLAPPLLIAFGLAVLLICAVGSTVTRDRRRCVALSNMAHCGVAACAIGVGAPQAAWLIVTALILVRLAVLLAHCDDPVGWMALTLLPVYALYLLAEPSAWLLPLAAGTLLAAAAMLRQQPSGWSTRWTVTAAVRLQLMLALILACATPAPVIAWFGAPA
jgi:hydrogenase-4 component F